MKKFLIYKKLETKKNYILIEKIDGFYCKKNDSANKVIQALRRLFDDAGPGVKWLLRHLNDPKSRGICGSLTEVSLYDNKVILQPSRTLEENPEDFSIEIDRDILIQLATDWQNLVRKEVPEIFIFCKNDEYFVADTLPEGVD